jgi:hypothetical protein
MATKLPPAPIRTPVVDRVGLPTQPWASWFNYVYALVGLGGTKGDKGDAGPAGPAGQTGATGPQGPAGSADVNGTAPRLAKFTGDKSIGNSIAYESNAEMIAIDGRQIINQLVNVNTTIQTSKTMITGSLDVTAGITMTIDAGGELICL